MLRADDGDCGVDFDGAEGVEGVWEGGCCGDLVGELLDAVEDHCVCLALLVVAMRGKMLRLHIEDGVFILTPPLLTHGWMYMAATHAYQ